VCEACRPKRAFSTVNIAHAKITDLKFAEFPWVVGEPIQVLCVARACTPRKKMRAIAGYSVFRFAEFVF
jgi:hypothetical protein